MVGTRPPQKISHWEQLTLLTDQASPAKSSQSLSSSEPAYLILHLTFFPHFSQALEAIALNVTDNLCSSTVPSSQHLSSSCTSSPKSSVSKPSPSTSPSVFFFNSLSWSLVRSQHFLRVTASVVPKMAELPFFLFFAATFALPRRF